MKIDCKIKSIGENRQGTNATTGNQWNIRPIVVEWQENRTRGDGTIFAVTNTLRVDILGDHAKNFNLAEGSNVTIDVRFETSQWQDRTMNNIRSSFIILR